jgi:hypothetical protein
MTHADAGELQTGCDHRLDPRNRVTMAEPLDTGFLAEVEQHEIAFRKFIAEYALEAKPVWHVDCRIW